MTALNGVYKVCETNETRLYVKLMKIRDISHEIQFIKLIQVHERVRRHSSTSDHSLSDVGLSETVDNQLPSSF